MAMIFVLSIIYNAAVHQLTGNVSVNKHLKVIRQLQKIIQLPFFIFAITFMLFSNGCYS